MTSLVACLGSEKKTIAHVDEIIKRQEWDKVFLVSAEKQRLNANKHVEYILIDPNKFLPELVEEIRSKLRGKIDDTEVALNVISGNGKQHMAVISALLKLGLGIRLVALTKDGIKEI